MAVIFDLDDTLADARRRAPLQGDWDAWHEDAINDPPIRSMIYVFRALSHFYTSLIITARNERFRAPTIRWLMANGVNADVVLMRPEGDYRSSPDLKIALAESHFGPTLENLLLVVDDREDVLSAFRARGITTLQATYSEGIIT